MLSLVDSFISITSTLTAHGRRAFVRSLWRTVTRVETTVLEQNVVYIAICHLTPTIN